MNMKNWIWVPLAALVGLLVGSWGPREDIRLMRERAQDARNDRKVANAAGFNAFAHLANIPDVAKRPQRAAADAGSNATERAELSPTDREERRRRHLREQLMRRDLRTRIDEAAELWQTRVELAKSQWRERLSIADGAEAEAFEAALGDMNESLRETMQALADEIERAGRVTPELGLRMMGDASRVMAETYDALGANLPEDRRAEVAEMPVFDFIDPSVAEPLIRVQDKLEVSLPEERRP